ncbi:A/G-specific adenine glycosylase [Desulfobaculum xiamenense]|uniref:Adenine DNA glycosylase n=1 Tax=Desulfobaculum xiamenense TaxID=995050 RepID=A0A846QLA6_9BACT|nr:A/G-specific adenine glycosylase [Desulfobaculum xiamenense]NJB68901.1 A/G-specific adenine glycosylase [Desulfobaculum xiamenense]
MPESSTFARRIIDWFEHNRRDLPWRRTYTPYQVWISEMMLQQTQMDRAVPYFERFVARFPDVHALAAANEEEVLKLWEGLGYYSRARNIARAARIVAESGGEFPRSRAELTALPGIGPYTAGAILSIAYNEDEPAVDANVERVYARVFDIDAPMAEREAKARVRELAAQLLPTGESRIYNQAVMELGALVCTPRAPRCDTCPVSEDCEARRLGIVAQRPVPGRKKDIVPLEVATGVLVRDGRLFVQKRPEGQVWAGLWEFPGGTVEAGETPQQAVVREFDEETGFTVSVREPIAIVRHGYTRFRVTLHCFLLDMADASAEPHLTAATEYRWATPRQLDELAFPAGHRKLMDLMRGDIRFTHLFRI